MAFPETNIATNSDDAVFVIGLKRGLPETDLTYGVNASNLPTRGIEGQDSERGVWYLTYDMK